MAEFLRVLRTSIAKYVKGAANETIQNSPLLAMLQKRGRMIFNDSGKTLDWQIKTKQRALTPRTDMEQIQFARQNLYENATLPWRGYVMQDAISQKERYMVRGKEALVQIWPNKMRSMMEDARDRMNIEVYVDGNASGNEEKIHGLESIFGGTGTTTTEYATSSESYAGLSPAAVHGTESATSPYSPQLVQETYTGFGTWASNPTKVSRSLISACRIKNGKMGSPDVLITTESRYNEFKNALASEERYIIAEQVIEGLKAGFRGLAYDGVDVIWDFDCPSARTYCLNLDQIEFRCLSPDLFYSRTEYSIEQDAYLWSVMHWGNMRINPRYQGKAADFSS
ncbi:MAG: phage major capsid protein [Planctomycetota bacterium]|jgi:hypothetical protein